jgi:lysophospholipase L1-like esterase
MSRIKSLLVLSSLITAAWLLSLLASRTVAQAGAANALRRFDFGPGTIATGYTQVLPDMLYGSERSYGFEPGATLKGVTRAGKDDLRNDLITSSQPFYFSVALPPGNYRVTVTLGDQAEATSTTVKAELRRLMLENIATSKGQFAMRSFIVNVRTPQFHGGEVRLKDREKTTEWWAWDEKLTLEFNGAHPAVCALEVVCVDVPTVYLLGDSTICDQPREPYNSWGQMLPRFFNDRVAIANHAESGESLKSSLGAKRLDKVLSLLKRGDYLFLQFGHNDQKEKGEGGGAFTSYKADMKRFVVAARERGAVPVLVTSMHRRTFDPQGRVTNSLGDYPEAVRQLARAERVALIDLHAMSKTLYQTLGPEGSSVLFKEGDGTHHSNYGSYELAQCVVAGIKANKLGLTKYLLKDVQAFDPARPDAFARFGVPPSPQQTNVKPLGN